MDLIGELFTYYWQNGSYVLEQFWRHFLMSAYGVLFAAIVAIPLGIFTARHANLSGIVFFIANFIQTIPSLAMLAILMLVLGLGATTVIVSLFLYSLLPILKNTYAGIRGVDPSLLESGKAMGMTKGQILWKVEIPLSLAVIMGGLRNALVVAIGITAVGTFIGAGGLGDIIVRGTNVTNGAPIILAGAIPTALMAVSADLLMGWFERKLLPANQKRAARPS
ncbi:MAG: amino acid ABC transporter permease [Caldibacillus debilis]|uniref:Amino acid ABC transporter permease n=1 Tax=Caldibacillus debilis TaxID=301148 RepID=A0A3E0K795_9BACI|nr:ABC transporter permease [Caldibacillus debilis]REJ30195.1 MAG: amino acid ABC transporter permease [Caldibacillus debilis]